MVGLKSKTDAELLALMASDNYGAFEVLYNRYAYGIKNILVKVLKSATVAEDICQDIFLNFWEKRRSLIHIHSLKAYLFTIARNRAIDSLKAAVRNESSLIEILQQFDGHSNGAEVELLDKEYQVFLQRILQSLPERTRLIFSLCREQSKSYEEVGSVLGISRNAVKNHMVLSMKILKSSAQKEFGLSLAIVLSCIFRH